MPEITWGVGCGNAQVLSIAAVEGAAEKLGAAAQVVLPGQASGTLLAGKPGIDHHMISLFQTGHTSPNRCHLARAVAAEDQGRRELPFKATIARPGIEVKAIQGRGAHPHLHVAGARFGFRPLPVGQNLGAAVRLYVYRLHQ